MNDEELTILVQTQWPNLSSNMLEAKECFRAGEELGRASALSELEATIATMRSPQPQVTTPQR